MSDGTGYVFEAAVNVSERERLRALEAIFDGATRESLASTLDLEGRRVLEIGAGAGSISRWLAEQVGPSGHVVALDTNTRFLDDLPGVEVIEGSLLDVTLPPFDLVHARYVAIHNAESARFLNAVVNHVTPGGWVVLEETGLSRCAFVGGSRRRGSRPRPSPKSTSLPAVPTRRTSPATKSSAKRRSAGASTTRPEVSRVADGLDVTVL